ncbi:MAG: hypothetical protein L3K08_02205 [Thermoplasmata archaeon]|nr:hypothetical protein [Thermoplasmata archaeon]
MSEECPDCGATFADPAELVQHLNKAHAGGNATASMAMNPYASSPGLTCSLCGATFATPDALAAHGLKPHPNPRRSERHRGFIRARST